MNLNKKVFDNKVYDTNRYVLILFFSFPNFLLNLLNINNLFHFFQLLLFSLNHQKSLYKKRKPFYSFRTKWSYHYFVYFSFKASSTQGGTSPVSSL